MFWEKKYRFMLFYFYAFKLSILNYSVWYAYVALASVNCIEIWMTELINSEATLSGKCSRCPVFIHTAAFRVSVCGNSACKGNSSLAPSLCLAILAILGVILCLLPLISGSWNGERSNCSRLFPPLCYYEMNTRSGKRRDFLGSATVEAHLH